MGKVPWGFLDEKEGSINNTYVIFKPAMMQWVNYGNVEITNNIVYQKFCINFCGNMI